MIRIKMKVLIDEKEHELGELSQAEKSLIYYIRNEFRWGEIIIEAQDGQPWRMRQTTKYRIC